MQHERIGPTVARLTGEASSRSAMRCSVGRRHALDLVDQLLGGKRPSVNENLAGELLGPGAAALQPGKQAHLELGLDAADLLLAEAADRRRAGARRARRREAPRRGRARKRHRPRTCRRRRGQRQKRGSRSKARASRAPPGRGARTCRRRARRRRLARRNSRHGGKAAPRRRAPYGSARRASPSAPRRRDKAPARALAPCLCQASPSRRSASARSLS